MEKSKNEIDEYFDNMLFSPMDLLNIPKIALPPLPALPKNKKQENKKPLPALPKNKKPLPPPRRSPISYINKRKDTPEELVRLIINSTSEKYKLKYYRKLVKRTENKRAVVGFTMNSGLEHYFTLTNDFTHKVDKLLSGEQKTPTYESDDEMYGIFLNDGVESIKIHYTPEGLRDKGRFMKYFHSIPDLDLRIIQIKRDANDLIGIYKQPSNEIKTLNEKIEEEANLNNVYLKSLGFTTSEKQNADYTIEQIKLIEELDDKIKILEELEEEINLPEVANLNTDYLKSLGLEEIKEEIKEEINLVIKEEIRKKIIIDKTEILKNNKTRRMDIIEEHCLIHSLRVLGCNSDKLELVKEYVGYNSFKTRDLTPLSEKLDCKFRLSVVPHDNKSHQSKKFGNPECKKEYHLVLYDGHYMPNVAFKMTSWAIVNYEKVKEFKNWKNIKYIQTKKGAKVPHRNYDAEIDTVKLIASMRDSKRFYWDDTIHERAEFRHEFSTSYFTDDILNGCQRELEVKDKKDINQDFIFGADFESIVSGVDRHKAFLLGCVSANGIYKRVFKATKENLDSCGIFMEMLENLISTYGKKIKEYDYEHESSDEKVFNALQKYIEDLKQKLNRVNRRLVNIPLSIVKDTKEFDTNYIIREGCRRSLNVLDVNEVNTDPLVIQNIEKILNENYEKAMVRCEVLESRKTKKTLLLKQLEKVKTEIISEIEKITIEYKLPEIKSKIKLQSKFIIYFHNLKYDFALIQSCKFLNISNLCAKSNNIYSTTIRYKDFTFELRDSYKMLAMPLRDFKEALDLKSGKKDFALYEYFTSNNFTNKTTKIKDLQKFDKKLTYDNLKKRGLERFITEDKKSINVINFYVDYMMADCETMMEGLKKFNTMMLNEINLNSFNFLTISSMAHHYFSKTCYNGIYEVSGTLREFIARANVGGRVCLKNNKKQNRSRRGIKLYMENVEVLKHETRKSKIEILKKKIASYRRVVKKMQDFDGVSLYPSAMRMSQLPLGKCKLLTKETCLEIQKELKEHSEKIETLKNLEILPLCENATPVQFYKRVVSELNRINRFKTIENETQLFQHYSHYSHYVVEVLLKTEGYQQIPFLCGENDDEVRDWTNSLTKSVVMNKIDLVNLVKYYTIENLEIIQGVYWNNGVSSTIQEHIQKLFDRRAEAKRQGNNGLQMVLKLFMNSAYGKCNLKPSKSNIKYMTRKDMPAFLRNNYEYIKQFTYLNTEPVIINGVEREDAKYDRVKIKTRNNTYIHYNLAHIAGIYLSNSKVIMNDLLNVFTILGREALYTDTDSIHMFDEDIPAISKKYKEIYERGLIGKGLGQFHDDFAPHTPKFDKNNVKIPKSLRKSYPQYSIHFIGIGKKSYLDVLANDYDNTINYHVRFKGANETNIDAYCKKEKITLFEFYENLYNGDEVLLDLCAGKTRFDYDEKGRVFTRPIFQRWFDFLTPEQIELKKKRRVERKEAKKINK